MKERTNRGITLIALVVTIIVLIILATVSINAVFNENGIINQAKKAKEHQANAVASDEEMMAKLEQEYANVMAEETETLKDITSETPAGEKVKIPSEWTTLDGDAISNGNGVAIPLPSGFYYVGGNIETGLVISDREEDTIDSSGVESGNQFVWIPVESSSVFVTNDDETMKSQVLKYGGFYFGRYEGGINSTNLRTETTGLQTVVSKKGVAPYNYVAWEEAKNASENMYISSTSVRSTLCYGGQWDAMCEYIEDASRTAEIKDNAELTGSVNSDVSKNIYDLAGNCGEYTMEEGESFSGGSIHIIRGGLTFWGMGNSIDTRGNTNDEYGWQDGYTSEAIGFRCTLYVK